jgi:hypothetical protein
LEKRGPGRVGSGADQDLALLQSAELAWFAYDPDGSGHPTTTGWRPRHQRVRILQRREDQIRIDERYAGQLFAPGRPATHHIAQPVSLARLNAAGVGNCFELFQP